MYCLLKQTILIAVVTTLLVNSSTSKIKTTNNANPLDIEHVHVVFMNHLDIGYGGGHLHVGFVNNVLNLYFNQYFPRAIDIASQMSDYNSTTKTTTNINTNTNSNSNDTKYKNNNNGGFIYTTHPWLVSMYLECPKNFVLSNIELQCPNDTEISKFKDAISKGWITWHASPFNGQFEMMDDTLFESTLYMADYLDNITNNPFISHNKVISNRDVPGVTRAAIPIMRKHNVTAISVGRLYLLRILIFQYFNRFFVCLLSLVFGVLQNSKANNTEKKQKQKQKKWTVVNILKREKKPKKPTTGQNAKVAPVDEKIFLWRDNDTDSEVIAMFHAHGYGGINTSDCVFVNFSTHALCMNFRKDNSGPPESVDEVLRNYSTIQQEFPNANVFASTFDAFINEIWDKRSKLTPLISNEIGDAWIQGIASDPIKLKLYRQMTRLRRQFLSNQEDVSLELENEKNGKLTGCTAHDLRYFDRYLMKMTEHTWGIASSHDGTFWANSAFHPKVNNFSAFINCSQSWLEQREFATLAVDTLPDDMNSNRKNWKTSEDSDDSEDSECDLGEFKRYLLNNISDYMYVPSINDIWNTISTEYYTDLSDDLTQLIICDDYTFKFDGKYGNLVYLSLRLNSSNNLTWIVNDNVDATGIESGIIGINYQSFNQTDFKYMSTYYGSNPGINKPNLPSDATIRGKWQPNMIGLYFSKLLKSVVIHLQFEEIVNTFIGAPKDVFVNLTFVQDHVNQHGKIEADVLYFNKTLTRLPEQMMVQFMPQLLQTDDIAIGGGGATVDVNYFVNKMDTLWINLNDVIINGSQYQHGSGLYNGAKMVNNVENINMDIDGMNDIDDSNSEFKFEFVVNSFDCGVMCPVTNELETQDWMGSPTVIPVPLRPLTVDNKIEIKGFAWNVFNNIWNTNYILWFPFVNQWNQSIMTPMNEQNNKITFEILLKY